VLLAAAPGVQMPARAELPPSEKVVVAGAAPPAGSPPGARVAFSATSEDGFAVTLIESRGQPPIGVGEGTWPTIRATFEQIGVTETFFS